MTGWKSAVCMALAAVVALAPSRTDAFAQWRGGEGYAEARGSLRVVGYASEYPDAPLLYPDRRKPDFVTVGRLIALGRAASWLRFDFNVYHLTDSDTAGLAASDLSVGGVERSPALETVYTGQNAAEGRMAVDRLNVTLSAGRFDLTLGRQAVNMATCFYFTPNDFFGPFAAQDFYRVYKAGIDAARLETRLGPLSQMTLLAVAGYEPDAGASNGFSQGVSTERSSLIARVSTVVHNMELAALGGRAGKTSIAGASLQGEIGQWLGVRAEGHYANPETGEDYMELSVEAEHRWPSSLTLRAAWFHHGAGAARPAEYLAALSERTMGPLYLGRSYAAAGAGYEFTPLTTSELVAVANLNDGSFLVSVNTVHSLADEAEFSWGVALPVGEKPESLDIKSEYGTYPASVNFELRVYF